MESLKPLPPLPLRTHSRLGPSNSRYSTRSRYCPTADLLDCYIEIEDTEPFAEPSTHARPQRSNTARSILGRFNTPRDIIQRPSVQKSILQRPITRKAVPQRSNTQRSRWTWIEPLDNILKEPDIWDNPFEGICPESASSDSFVTDRTLLPGRDPTFEVTWAKDGSDMPRKWPAWYRAMSLTFISFATLVV